jgi:hypothetical protein
MKYIQQTEKIHGKHHSKFLFLQVWTHRPIMRYVKATGKESAKTEGFTDGCISEN